MGKFKANGGTAALHIDQKGFAFTVEPGKIPADKVTCGQCGAVTGIKYPGYLVAGYRISCNEYHVEFYESVSYDDGFKMQALMLESDITVEKGLLTKEKLEALLIQIISDHR